MRLGLVLGVLGKILRLFSLAFVPPTLLALADAWRGFTPWDHALPFVGAGLATAATGYLLSRWFHPNPRLHRAEALGVVAGAWFLVACFAAVPYVAEGLSAVDALFESISGLTTTGATILTDFGAYDRAFFLWRSMTQWFGGLGVIALFVVILPELGIAGRQIFFAEASDAGHELVSPRLRDIARRLWLLYLGLTVAEVLALTTLAGMPLYDSVCHALTTMPAGGFSPHPASIAGYDNPTAEWILVVFMTLAGMSFPLLWIALFRDPRALGRDGEFRFYLGTMLVTGVGAAAVLAGGVPDLEGLRTGLFQTASLISSTGYASTDWVLEPWTDAARTFLLVAMLVGGCAGSAAGGAKAVRHLLMLKFVGRELSRSLHPHGVLLVRYKGKPVTDDGLRAILNVVLLFLITYALVGAFLVVRGADFVTGFSASLACVGNIGPGFGAVGPMANFAELDVPSKVVLTLGMWAGRLELVTVLALLHPDVLRRLRWGARREV